MNRRDIYAKLLTTQELIGDLAALEGAGVEHEPVVGDLAPVEEAPPVGLERACGGGKGGGSELRSMVQ